MQSLIKSQNSFALCFIYRLVTPVQDMLSGNEPDQGWVAFETGRVEGAAYWADGARFDNHKA